MTTTRSQRNEHEPPRVLTNREQQHKIAGMIERSERHQSDIDSILNTMNNNIRLLALRQVSECVSLSKSSIYRKMEQGDFPRPLRIGSNTVRWLVTDIDKWVYELQHKN